MSRPVEEIEAELTRSLSRDRILCALIAIIEHKLFCVDVFLERLDQAKKEATNET